MVESLRSQAGDPAAPLTVIVPGALDQVTGGSIFDRRIVEGLRALGRPVRVVELAGRFPAADAEAMAAAEAALAGLADGAPAVIEGLALAGFAEALPRHARRLRLLGFVHHSLAVETGLAADAARHYAAIEAALLPLFRGILCPSTRTAVAVAAYGVAADRIAVTPPGTLKPLGAVPTPPPPLHLLCVATLTPRKGHLLLIEALATLRPLDWRLTLVGSLTRDPETAGAVRRAIDGHGLGGRVTLAGEYPPNRIGSAYAAAHVFVLPSWYEGYGMAFAEALAFGLPVIATTGGAIPETVPLSAGILVPPGDGAALAAALAAVLTDDGLRGRLAQGAAAAGARLCDWPAAVAGWCAAADRLLALGPA